MFVIYGTPVSELGIRQIFNRMSFLFTKRLWFVLLVNYCYSQTPSFINYNESNGLPSNESYFVYQDHEGFIWITTDNGVVKFDGQDFMLFNKQNGMADNVNFSIHPDSHNRLWFRSYSGALSMYENGRMNKYHLNKVIQKFMLKSLMFSMTFDIYDSLHLGMGSGIAMHIDTLGQYRIEQIPDFTLMINSLSESDPLVLYSNTPGKLDNLIVNGVRQKMNKYDDSPNNGNIGAKMFEGYIYVFNDRYLFRISEKECKIVLNTVRPIVSLATDNFGRLWIGMQAGGLICFEDGKFYSPSNLNTLKDLTVTSLLLDRNNRFWVTTLEKGVFYFPNQSIINYPSPSPSKLSAVAFTNNDAYFGNYDGSLYKFSMSKRSFELLSNYSSPILSIYYNSNTNELLVSCTSDTYIFNPGNNKSTTTRTSDRSIRGVKKFQKFNSAIVGGNLTGLFYFDLKGHCKHFDYSLIKIRTFLMTDNSVFIAPVSGLVKTDNALELYDTISALDDNKILDLDEYDNKLIIATAESGLLSLAGDSLKSYYDKNLLPCPLIRMIYINDKKLYLATECGLIIDGLDNTQAHSRILLNSRDGLLNNSINFIGFSGHSLLCFTPDGISVIDTMNMSHPDMTKFYLRKTLLNNNEVGDFQGSLPFRQNNISFHYGFISFNNRNIKVKHRPSQNFEWSPGNQSSVNYFSLSPGDYQPELAYSINGGPWNVVPLSQPFIIQLPWWETIYFQILSTVLIASIIGLVLYSIFQKKISQIKYQANLRNEKDRISRELHDNIGSRLAYIKLSMFNLKQESNFRSKKESIESQLTTTVNELRDTIWTINKDVVSLRDFVERVDSIVSRLQQIDFKIHFKFNIEEKDLNPTLHPALVINMHRIIQEALNNSIKHSGAKNIYVSIDLDVSGNLIIAVKDDGVGFDKNNVNNIDCYGLQSMKTRAEESELCLTIESKPDFGTEIKITHALV